MRLLPLLAVLLCLFCDDVFAAREAFEVVVNDPYIELHTGPGRGYPIFHVTERGERIEVLKRRTDWFKVRTPEGKEGWVKRKQMELTLLPTGEGVEFDDPVMNDVLAHRFEFGVQGGDLDGANLISAYRDMRLPRTSRPSYAVLVVWVTTPIPGWPAPISRIHFSRSGGSRRFSRLAPGLCIQNPSRHWYRPRIVPTRRYTPPPACVPI